MAETNASGDAAEPTQDEAPNATSSQTPPNHMTEQEKMKQKNPLGYTTTNATLNENPAPNVDPAEEEAKGHS